MSTLPTNRFQFFLFEVMVVQAKSRETFVPLLSLFYHFAIFEHISLHDLPRHKTKQQFSCEVSPTQEIF